MNLPFSPPRPSHCILCNVIAVQIIVLTGLPFPVAWERLAVVSHSRGELFACNLCMAPAAASWSFALRPTTG